MTMALDIAPAPADDAAWLREELAAPGWIDVAIRGDAPRLARALGASTGLDLVSLAQPLPDADAARLYRLWLGLRPGAPDAFVGWFNLGVILMRTGACDEAATAYENALTLNPALHEASVNLGLAREAAGNRPAAMLAWRRALPSRENRRMLHMQVGRMLEEDGDFDAASAELEACLALAPDQPDVQQHLVHMRQRMALWPVTGAAVPGVAEADLAQNCGPLAALALHDDPARQAAINAAWIARKVPAAPERLAPRAGYCHERIRIGYLSSDFCRHAMSYLIAEVLERHDRSAFEVYGYCASPDDGSDTRARVISAFDRFRAIRDLDDAAAARMIRADEIDILIDLNGLTKGARLGVLRWKPAPVQATYLGYIGPVPLPELDWLICDAVAVPPDLDALYAPRPLRVPGCYQANDSRPPDLPPVSRAAEGLPEAAFVFACFSHHYKITRPVFEAWLAILGAAPGSVLWLVEDGAASRRNLSALWAERGLAPERLIFAPRVDPAQYRARMALADLFLDTSPYNAGTIASDALRMGLPILTLQGRAFAARMATSLLTAMDLPELIAADLADYVHRAVRLAQRPEEAASLRARLSGDLWLRTLGDSEGFTRRLESALRSIRIQPAAV